MTSPLIGISSMATRQVLADLCDAYQARTGRVVRFESVGGVDAARRVAAGEAWDVVALASDALMRLVASGHVLAGSRVDLAHSGVAVAVPVGAPLPDVSSEAAVRAAVLAAPRIGYSTGPSGVALQALFERWGIVDAVAPRTVTPPPGVPVGSLVASGEVALGFQQLSELLHLPGIAVAGPLPPAIQVTTTFSAGVCAASQRPDEVRQLLAFLTSPAADDAKCRHGMAPAGDLPPAITGAAP